MYLLSWDLGLILLKVIRNAQSAPFSAGDDKLWITKDTANLTSECCGRKNEMGNSEHPQPKYSGLFRGPPPGYTE